MPLRAVSYLSCILAFPRNVWEPFVCNCFLQFMGKNLNEKRQRLGQKLERKTKTTWTQTLTKNENDLDKNVNEKRKRFEHKLERKTKTTWTKT